MTVSMMLGGFAFEARDRLGYEGVQRKVQTPWAEIKVAQTMDQQQWTGPTSEEVTIRGVLFPQEYGGQASLDGIIAAAQAGTPMMLVSGDDYEGVIHGMFTVQGIDEDRSYHNAAGAPRKNSYSITLKRYGQSTAGGGLFAPILNLFR